jgi:hypothetical protein
MLEKKIDIDLFNSIKKENLHLNTIDKNNIIKELKYFSKEGYCFGDFDILGKGSKYQSAFAVERSEILYIHKEYFMEFFSKSILRSQVERKNFIKSVFNIFEDEEEDNNFNDFYSKTKAIVNIIKNKYIYINKYLIYFNYNYYFNFHKFKFNLNLSFFFLLLYFTLMKFNFIELTFLVF